MKKIIIIFQLILGRLQIFLLRYNKQVSLGDKVKFQGHLLLDLHKNARLDLAYGVVINSINHGYHINMHSPCKIMADRPGSLISIGSNTRIHGTSIHAYESIRIGANCLIAANCQIMDGSGHDLSMNDVDHRVHTKGIAKPVTIEDSVWLCCNVIVLPGITIGKGSVITPNSVVARDIPSMVIAGGNPAKVIKSYEC